MEEIYKQMGSPFSSYEVSNLGNVRRQGNPPVKHCFTRNSNATVTIYDDGSKRVSLIVKDLVAEYFLTDYTYGDYVVIIDSDVSNVRVDNLRLLNPKEEHENPDRPNKKQIVTLILQMKTVKEMADIFGISDVTMRKLMRRYEIYEERLSVSLTNKVKPSPLQEEVWQNHPTISCLRVSNLGDVGYVNSSKPIAKNFETAKELVVTVNTGAVRKTMCVKNLVAEVFLTNPNNLPFVVHLDGDKTNNRVDNLCWSSYSATKRDTTYYAETSPLIREFLMSVPHTKKADFYRKHGITHDYLTFLLKKFGYPVRISDLVIARDAAIANGTLDRFLSGVDNIKRVDLEEGEIRKPVEGQEGYFITNKGRCISHRTFSTEKLVKPYLNKNGRSYLSIGIVSKTKYSASHLVAEHFLPKPLGNGEYKLIHIDCDLSNISADNLKWIKK